MATEQTTILQKDLRAGETSPSGERAKKAVLPAKQREDYFPSAFWPLVLMVVSIFLIEMLIESLIIRYIPMTLFQHVLVDAGATVLLLMPIFYYVLYRPFKRLDAARRQAQYDNQQLSRKLIRRIEEEKRHLARELHDDFGQVLTALQFGVATLKESCQVPTENATSCNRQAHRLTEMIANLGDQVRSFTVGLRPAILEELGLHAALQVLIEGDWAELQIKFTEQGESRRYDPEIELALFRICQEALNNTVKHARASSAAIDLCHGAQEILLRISDNGNGFDVESLIAGRDRRRGLGLLGLRERVASIGGELELRSSEGGGTQIQISLPAQLQRRRDETD